MRRDSYGHMVNDITLGELLNYATLIGFEHFDRDGLATFGFTEWIRCTMDIPDEIDDDMRPLLVQIELRRLAQLPVKDIVRQAQPEDQEWFYSLIAQLKCFINTPAALE